jgi:hypothetical protein
MSSTLYGRGTLLQTGGKARAERTEQALRDLYQQLTAVRHELTDLKKSHETLKAQVVSAGIVSTSPTTAPLPGPGPV